MTDLSTIAMRATGTAFQILYEPRAIPNSKPAPKKTGPKPKFSKAQESARSMETSTERAARHAADRQKKMDAILRKNSYSDIARSTDADKTGRIQGRRNAARSQ